jgi:cardiolipin synthase
VNLRQLPNAITGMRMLLVVPLVWSLRAGDYRLALGIALVAGASDAIDGRLAKGFGWKTRLGSLLDPVADKLMLIGSFVGLWLVGAAPGWLTALVIGRDVVIVSGALVYNAVIGPIEGDPTLLSKATTVAQIVLVLGLLVGLAWRPLSTDGVAAGVWVVAVLTLASGVDYVVRWGLRARRGLRAKRQARDPGA